MTEAISSTAQDDEAKRSQPKTTRTLLRGLAVLEALAEESQGLGPTRIAELVDLDKGTVSRLLQTLAAAGYVRREPTSGTYTLSPKILQLSEGLRQHLELRTVARPFLVRLCAEVHETVHLGVRDETRVVYVDKVEPLDQAIRMVSAVGRTMPLETTALGKAILANYPQPIAEEILSRIDFTSDERRTRLDQAAFDRELEATRTRGYAIDDRENMDTVICVAAPVFGPANSVVGAISISSPAFRVEERIEELGMQCREFAHEISEQVGAR